jgi:uncharacterized protein (TIGR00288 family)
VKGRHLLLGHAASLCNRRVMALFTRGDIMEGKVAEAARPQRKLALLIDGDNAQPKLIEKMIQEVNRYGVITVRRIYGDWTQQSMNSWKVHLHEHAIQPIQQFRNTVGKNATDSALIIDAMDLLHMHLVDGFAIISSDSDYTRLATRIREHGHFVMGIGEKKTPDAFVKSCEIFVYTENLQKEVQIPEVERTSRTETKKVRNAKLLKMLLKAFNMSVEDNGWAYLAVIGENLRKLDPSFDPRGYGYKQLLQLVRDHAEYFEFKGSGEGGASVYVRMKDWMG